MQKIINKELPAKHSINTQFNTMPMYQPINDNESKKLKVIDKTESEIQDIIVKSSFSTSKYDVELSQVPMNLKTDQLVMLGILSLNKITSETPLSVITKFNMKELTEKLGVRKCDLNSKRERERIIESIAKHKRCELNIFNKEEDDLQFGSFSLIKEFFVEKAGKDFNVTVEFSKKFLDMYLSSNKSFINLDIYKNLKSEYSKSLYVMINNIDNKKEKQNKITLFSGLVRNKFNAGEKLKRRQKDYIKKALTELEKSGIIKKAHNLTKDDEIFLVKEKMYLHDDIESLKTFREKTINDLLEIKENNEKNIIMKIQLLESYIKENKIMPKLQNDLQEEIKRLNKIIETEEETKEEIKETIETGDDLPF